MNWFTKTYVANRHLSERENLVQEHGGCEHCEADPSLLAWISYENDSFGREGHCLCLACHEKVSEEEGNEAHTCSDCKSTFLRKDGIEWKWYDFDYRQGDQPLYICKTCQTKQTHLNRVKQDTAACNEELAGQDPYDCY